MLGGGFHVCIDIFFHFLVKDRGVPKIGLSADIFIDRSLDIFIVISIGVFLHMFIRIWCDMSSPHAGLQMINV